jgi:UMF1 family MFS transporter
MYDWANSAYSTLSITILVVYLQRVVFPPDSWGQMGPVVWAWGIALSMLCGAVLSPLLGALADAQANKRKWLAVTALSGAVAAVLLSLMPPSFYVPVVLLFFWMSLMLELSLTVYNGFLPEIAAEDEMNRVSAWGYGFGYVGGGIALALAMLLMKYGVFLGLASLESQLRCGLLIMGLWWGLFTVPTILVLRDAGHPSQREQSVVSAAKSAVADITTTLRNLGSYRTLAWFLVGFLFYNDGVQTVISQASTFALSPDLNFSESELAGLILLIQFLALPGAIAIGRLADYLGQKKTLLICLAVWMGTLVAALRINQKFEFWILGGVIAIVMGGTQSVSRSLMGVMTPKDQSAKFFGFFNLSGKATGFFGTFSFGMIVAVSGSPRLAIFGLIPFFMIGAAIISRVNVSRGVEEKAAASAKGIAP